MLRGILDDTNRRADRYFAEVEGLRLQLQRRDEQLVELQQALVQEQGRLVELRNEVDRRDGEIDELQRRLREQGSAALVSERAGREARMQALEEELEKKRRDLPVARQQIRCLNERLEELGRDLERKQQLCEEADLASKDWTLQCLRCQMEWDKKLARTRKDVEALRSLLGEE